MLALRGPPDLPLASTPPSNIGSQGQPSEAPPWPPSASGTSQQPILSLAPCDPSTQELPESSELFHRAGDHRQPPGQHAPAGLQHLPLPGLVFPLQRRRGSGEG